MSEDTNRNFYTTWGDTDSLAEDTVPHGMDININNIHAFTFGAYIQLTCWLLTLIKKLFISYCDVSLSVRAVKHLHILVLFFKQVHQAVTVTSI